LLVGSLVVVFIGFVVDRVSAWQRDRLVEAEASQWEANAQARVKHMQAVRRAMIDLGSCAARPDRTRSGTVTCTIGARDRIAAELAGYAALGDFPQRDVALTNVRRNINDLDSELRRMQASVATQQEFEDALTGVQRTLDPLNAAIDRLASAAVHQTLRRTSQLKAILRRSEWAQVLVAATSFLIATLATLLAVRAMRRHQRALAAKADELEHFAATVAHDLLSPLASLGISMPVIQHRYPDDEQTQRLTARALSSVRRVRALVDGLLDFARSGASPKGARAQVAAVLRDVVNELAEQAAAAHAEVSVEDTDDRTVACSPSVLYSIASNLVANALKYLGDAPERKVHIRVRSRGAQLRVEVEDTGPGVPSALTRSIFEPYVRGPGTGKSGLGLGLATVKRLVCAHGGDVGVRAAESGGAVFWFDLPRAGGFDANKSPRASA
jgi:signal transduction histidine kinase